MSNERDDALILKIKHDSCVEDNSTIRIIDNLLKLIQAQMNRINNLEDDLDNIRGRVENLE